MNSCAKSTSSALSAWMATMAPRPQVVQVVAVTWAVLAVGHRVGNSRSQSTRPRSMMVH